MGLIAYVCGLITGLVLLPTIRWFVEELLDVDQYYGRDHLTGVEARKRLFTGDDQ